MRKTVLIFIVMFVLSSCNKDQIEIKFPINAEVYIGDVTFYAEIFQDSISFISDELSEPVVFRSAELELGKSNYPCLVNGNSAFVLFDLVDYIYANGVGKGIFNGYCYTCEIEEERIKSLIWGDIYVNFKYLE